MRDAGSWGFAFPHFQGFALLLRGSGFSVYSLADLIERSRAFSTSEKTNAITRLMIQATLRLWLLLSGM